MGSSLVLLAACSSPEIDIPVEPSSSSEESPAPTPPSPQRPFGLSSGLPFAECGPLEPSVQQPGEYVSTTVPQPDSRFMGYLLGFSAADKLCRVTALRSVRTGSEGAAVRAAFAELQKEVSSTYGNDSQVVDDVQADSSWTGPADWMIALQKEERMLAAIWPKEGDLAGEVTGVYLQTDATSINSALLRLTFYFKHPC